MPREKPTPPKSKLRELYWDEGLKMKDLAERYDVCQSMISNWLRGMNIPTRQSAPKPKRPSKKILRDLYWGGMLNTYEIADQLGVAQQSVVRWLSSTTILICCSTHSYICFNLASPSSG